MELRCGIPLIADLRALQQQALYREHVEFNQRFLEAHRPAIQRYGRLWGTDPFFLWSRRWEYPFTVGRVLNYARAQGRTALRILDAGSGVTYVPYLLCERLEGSTVVCADSNASYRQIFDDVNATIARNGGKTASCVSFLETMLQKLPLGDHEMDVVCCISVLEHTDNYGEILDEFARVLRRGGLLVLTFDLSLDGRFNLSRQRAADLLKKLNERFIPAPGLDVTGELSRMDQRDQILSTDHVKKTEPHMLPWKYPLLKAAHDLLHGHGWTGGFRSKAVYCLDAIAR